MEVVKTSKGGDMLMYQGYSYVKKVQRMATGVGVVRKPGYKPALAP